MRSSASCLRALSAVCRSARATLTRVLLPLDQIAHATSRQERGDRGDDQDSGDHGPEDRDCRVTPGPAGVASRSRCRARQDRLVVEEPAQVLGHLVGRLVAALRILVDRLEDDGFEVCAGFACRCRRGPDRVLRLDLLDQLQAVGSVEGRLEREQLVERQAKAVDVGPGIAFAAKPLGGDVAKRAEDVAGLSQAVVVGLGEPEVGDPDDAVGVEQQVRWLDVAVDDAPGMRVGQALGDLEADPRDAPAYLDRCRFDRRDLGSAGQHGRAVRRPGDGKASERQAARNTCRAVPLLAAGGIGGGRPSGGSGSAAVARVGGDAPASQERRARLRVGLEIVRSATSGRPADFVSFGRESGRSRSGRVAPSDVVD